MKQFLLILSFIFSCFLDSIQGFVVTTTNQGIHPPPTASSLFSPSVRTSSSLSSSECDDDNCPPSLNILLRSIQELATASGSDIRGRVVDHKRLGSINIASRAIALASEESSKIPILTPLAAYCFGYAFSQMLVSEQPQNHNNNDEDDDTTTKNRITIAIGQDPRSHGRRLCDSFARGAQSYEDSKNTIQVVYTGIATTPSMFEFCRAGLCDGGVMITASHLPTDRNGFKFFTKRSGGGYTKANIQQMGIYAKEHIQLWHDRNLLPPSSGDNAVFCSEWVDYMPYYATTLKNAIYKAVGEGVEKPLEGIKIVLNPGHGSGVFFNDVLKDLGADVSGSINLQHDPTFPEGVPNPELASMITTTINACKKVNADLGILFDTDADRCGFVVKKKKSGKTAEEAKDDMDYEEINKNRLIALLSVIFSESSPGCAIVTDSTTSEGLSKFIEQKLGLLHIRYLRGYANVINKAKDITSQGIANAEMAIETSGHCAMKENGYLDDGTYTAVKVLTLLAQQKQKQNNNDFNLLDLISDLEEMDFVQEFRFKAKDGSLPTTARIFDLIALEIERLAETCPEDNAEDGTIECIINTLPWRIDKDNQEGIRVRCGYGSFFMLRKSLHDPVLSFQVESKSKEEALDIIIQPLLSIFQSIESIQRNLEYDTLEQFK